MTKMTPPPPRPSSPRLVPALVVAVAALCVFQLWWAMTISGRVEEISSLKTELQAQLVQLEDVSARVEKAALQVGQPGERLEGIELKMEGLQTVADEWEFIVEDIQRIDSKISKLIVAFENQMGTEVDNPAPVVPDLDWTQPALFEAARRAADSVGITLTEDEVRVPSKLVLRQGLLEYFAVLKGGKEHEALVSLVGNTPEDDRRPAEFGAKLNNAIQALGFKRGKPIRFTPGGTKPAQGETIHLYIEWKDGDETITALASDLVWNRRTGAPMAPGKWVYVGSSYVAGDAPGSTQFAADLTAEAIATYSAVNTIIDNTTEGAADDTVFIAATPRLPEEFGVVTLILRKEPLPAADVRVFADAPLSEEDMKPSGAGEEDDDSGR
jgi:hypothetical protein